MIDLLIHRAAKIAKSSIEPDPCFYLGWRGCSSVDQFFKSIIPRIQNSAFWVSAKELIASLFPSLTVTLIGLGVSNPFPVTRQLGFFRIAFSPAAVHYLKSPSTNMATTLLSFVRSRAMFKSVLSFSGSSPSWIVFRFFSSIPSSSISIFARLTAMVKAVRGRFITVKFSHGLQSVACITLLDWYTSIGHAVYACTVKV